jgi:hypothetical protein
LVKLIPKNRSTLGREVGLEKEAMLGHLGVGGIVVTIGNL